MINVFIKKLNPDAIMPTYANEGDAGADLYSIEDAVLYPFDITLIKTGISLEIPKGYEGCIRPRSGNALTGYTVFNSPGTIDSNYRGEIGVILFNGNPDLHINIKKGDRIAQIVFQKIPSVTFIEKNVLTKTNRGDKGFGSTGY